jgi:MbtH protein
MVAGCPCLVGGLGAGCRLGISVVMVNDEGQHSLWPVFADVPDGWRVVFGQAGRDECLGFIEESWRDMRPKSLIEAMGK